MGNWLRMLWKILDHNVVWGLILFLLSSPFIARAVAWVSEFSAVTVEEVLFVYVGWVLLVILPLVFFGWLIKHWNAWRLVHFEDLCHFAAFDPFLRLVAFRKRKSFVSDKVHEALKPFKLPRGKCYFEYRHSRDFVVGGIHLHSIPATAQPVVVFKLLVRDYLAVPDFYDLRLLRHLVHDGAAIVVVLQDIPFGIRSSDIPEARRKTLHFARRILGSGPRIEFLSNLLSNDRAEFVRFMLDEYIPVYLSQHPKSRQETASGMLSDGISYFTFPLLIKALSRIIGSETPVVVIQWRERADKWRDFSQQIERWGLGIRIGGFILGATFLDHKGEKWKTTIQYSTQDVLFNLTDSPHDIKEKINRREERNGILECIIPDGYVDFLLTSLVGYKQRSHQTSHSVGKSNREKFVEEFTRISKELWRGFGSKR